MHVPAHLTDVEAATLPLAGVTAWHAVGERGEVRSGATVLVHGTGGVAAHALRLVVDRVFAWDELPRALAWLESGAHFRKVCVRV